MSLLYFPSQATSASGGALNFLSKTTLSSSSGSEYSISSDYDSYQFELIDFTTSAQANVLFSLSSDGTNFTVPITAIEQYVENRSGTYSTFETLSDAGPTDLTTGLMIFGSYAYSSQTGRSSTAWIKLINPNSDTYYKKFWLQTGYDNLYIGVDRFYSRTGGGTAKTTSAISKVKFSPSTGTFDGVINVYGVKDSS
tara:strand:+ start:2669 stop:3256 length:588 start_codon:yes stop_codon:yes gene_type:complete